MSSDVDYSCATCSKPVKGNSIMLFVFCDRGECIVAVMVMLQRRLLAPRAKQEAEANILTATTVVMVNGSSLSENQWKNRTMCQHTFKQQLLIDMN